MTRNPSKKFHLANDRDHISNLHPSLLSNILSRLPTKCAVKTSVLSKYWEYNWTLSYNVDIKCRTQHYNATTFANFVDRVLLHTQHIRNFRLICPFDYNDFSRVATWVQTAMNMKSVEIYAPSLTTFSSETTLDGEESSCSIVIHGAKLSTFIISGGLPEKVILCGSSVFSACLSCVGGLEDSSSPINIRLQVQKLVNEFSSLKVLELSEFMAEASQGSHRPYCYNSLRRLTLHGCVPKQLLQLLHAAPLLNSLYVNVFECEEYKYDEMEYVPSCIISHLEKITFKGFVGETPQYNLAKLLLENGENLKEVILIGPSALESRKEIKKHVSALRKVSNCSIIVA